MALAAPIATLALAAALGFSLAWLRPDLDLRPRAAALRSLAAASPAAAAIALVGGDAEAAVFFAALAALAVADLSARLLPDEATLPLIALGLIFGAAAGFDEGARRLAGAAAAYAALRLVAAVGARVMGREAMGRGDAKLFAAIGAFLGWRTLPEVALIAALAGVAYGLAIRPRDEAIPFGPPLAFAALVVWVLDALAVGPSLG